MYACVLCVCTHMQTQTQGMRKRQTNEMITWRGIQQTTSSNFHKLFCFSLAAMSDPYAQKPFPSFLHSVTHFVTIVPVTALLSFKPGHSQTIYEISVLFNNQLYLIALISWKYIFIKIQRRRSSDHLQCM